MLGHGGKNDMAHYQAVDQVCKSGIKTLLNYFVKFDIMLLLIVHGVECIGLALLQFFLAVGGEVSNQEAVTRRVPQGLV